jgi:hypothetical protein
MLWFFVIVVVLLAAAWGLYWRWDKKIRAEVAEGAAIEWARLNNSEPEFLNGITEEKFREIYARVHTPRFPGYALAAITTFFVTLPVTFALLTGLMIGAQELGVFPEPVELADRDAPPEAALYYIRDLAGFYYFFGMIIVWLVIVWFFMRRFHARRPGYLRDEIIRARG